VSGDWRTVRIGDVCDLMTGGTPSRSEAQYYEGGSIPWLVSGDVHRGQIYDCDGRITPLGLKNSSARWLPVNSVIIALNGQGKTRGTVALLHVEATCNQSLVSIKPKSDSELMPEFLYWNLHSRYEEVRRITGDDGNERRGLNMPLIRSIKIPLPPFEEQRRIVAVLDEAFSAVATANSNAEKTIHLTEALLAAAIGDIFSSRLGNDWRLATVGGLAARHKGSMRTGPFGSQLLHSEFVESGIAVLGIDNAVHNTFQWGKRRFIAESKFQELSRFLVHPGDVIITIMGTCGRCAVVPDDIPRAINSKHLFCITLDKQQCLPEYLHAYFLHAPDARTYLEERAQGSIMAGLNMGIIREMPVRVPPLAMQREVVDSINRATHSSHSIAAISTSKIRAYSTLKQSLLNWAFSTKLGADTKVAPKAFNDNFATPEFAAQALAFARARHVEARRAANFGRVKAQKTLHAVEAIGGVNLGRKPIKDAAGPNDFQHMLQAEKWAKRHRFFEFVPRSNGGYDFCPLENYNKLLDEATRKIEEAGASARRAIELLVDMDSDFAEIVVTTHAAWNNLILDGSTAVDDAIVQAARDDWHRDKMRFDKSRFHDAIRFIRSNGIVPDGSARRVGGQEKLPL
jgi:type I restriction enzyme S subunit